MKGVKETIEFEERKKKSKPNWFVKVRLVNFHIGVSLWNTDIIQMFCTYVSDRRLLLLSMACIEI